MSVNGEILQALYSAVDELNLQLPPDVRLEKSAATPIVGDGASLDSIGFLNLILLAEARVNESCSASISLAEHLLEEDGDPPATLGALASAIASLQELPQ
jgi:hypothetical protein